MRLCQIREIVHPIFIGAALSLMVAGTGASAQFEINYPDRPVAEGETLLEWSDPPVLKHTIPENERSDLSACSAQHDFDLGKAAYTCWPLLRALQLFTLADYAAGEPTGDKQSNLRQGIDYADQTLDFIGDPQWPLEELLRTRALRLKVSALTKLDEWEAALSTNRALITNIEGDLYRFDNFDLGFARRKQSEILLQLGMIGEAKTNLEQARALLFKPDGDKNGWPFTDQSEAMILAAIRRGEFAYAERITDRYLDHLRSEPRGSQFGLTDHLDFKLYLVARNRDRTAALQLIEERSAKDDRTNRCPAANLQFPLMLAPFRDDEAVINALSRAGCSGALSARFEAVIKYGLRNRAGDLILPYPAGEEDNTSIFPGDTQ